MFLLIAKAEQSREHAAETDESDCVTSCSSSSAIGHTLMLSLHRHQRPPRREGV